MLWQKAKRRIILWPESQGVHCKIQQKCFKLVRGFFYSLSGKPDRKYQRFWRVCFGGNLLIRKDAWYLFTDYAAVVSVSELIIDLKMSILSIFSATRVRCSISDAVSWLYWCEPCEWRFLLNYLLIWRWKRRISTVPYDRDCIYICVIIVEVDAKVVT